MGQIALASYAGVLFIQLFIGVLSILGILGNILVVISVIRNRSMHTVMHYLLVNLAIADTLVAVFLLMRYVFADMMVYPLDVRGDIICKFVSFGTISWVGLHAQVFTLIVISFERYSAVIHPHSSRGRLTRKKLKIVLVACWLYAIGFIMPDFIAIRYDQKKASCIYDWSKIIQKTWAFLWFFTCGPIPLVSMGVLYGKVVYSLWIKKEGRTSESRKAVIQSRKRVTKVVIMITIIYGICWLPNLTMWLAANFIQLPNQGFLINVTHILLLFNSSVNPLVYSVQSQHFRRCMIRTLQFWKPRNSFASEVQDTRTNTNTGSANAKGGHTSRDQDCKSSHVVLEGRVPSGIIQKPHHYLEGKKRFSLVKADCHSNSVHPMTQTMVVEEAGCHSNASCQEDKLLTIESGFGGTEQQNVCKLSTGKDFSVFQVDVDVVESSAKQVKFEQKHLQVTSKDGEENGNYGGVWVGPAEDEEKKDDCCPSALQAMEGKGTREKRVQSAFIKVKAFAAFAHSDGINKRGKNNLTELYPSFLDDFQPKDKGSHPREEDAKKSDNITDEKESKQDGLKPESKAIVEENEQKELQNHSRDDAVGASQKTDEKNKNTDNDSERKDLKVMESSTSLKTRKNEIRDNKTAFIELSDNTEMERKKLVLPRINRAGTPLVTMQHFTTKNEGQNTEYRREETFDKTAWLQEKEKMKLLRSLRELDITK